MGNKLYFALYGLILVLAILITVLVCTVFSEPEVVVMMNGGQLYYNKDGTISTDLSIEFNEHQDMFSENAENAYLININTAPKEELLDIPSVGEITAQKIINYREKTAFKKAEDLMNIEGIGEKKFEAMKSYICIE